MSAGTINWHCPACLELNTTSDKPHLTCTACGHVVKPTKTVLEFEGERLELETPHD